MILAIVFVRFSKEKKEGLESPTCKAAIDEWDMTGETFTPFMNAETKCKPYGTEGCTTPFTYGFCSGTLEYANGKCVASSTA